MLGDVRQPHHRRVRLLSAPSGNGAVPDVGWQPPAALGTAHVVEVDGVPRRYFEAGDAGGEPVVLVHGVPTSAALWRHVVPRLTDGGVVRVLAVELLGYGTSVHDQTDDAGDVRDLSVRAQGHGLGRLLEVLGARPAVLVGHDIGSGVVQVCAAADPSSVAGLVVTNGVVDDSWPVPPVQAVKVAGAAVSRLPFVAVRTFFRAGLRLGYVDGAAAAEGTRWHLRPYAAAERRGTGGARALVRQVDAFDDRHTREVVDAVAALDVPARLVWGEADRFQTVAAGQRLAGLLGVELRRLPGLRHWTPEEAPDEVAAAVLEVVDDVRAARPDA